MVTNTQFSDSFQAIADPSRREILKLLSKDSLTINSLAENFEMSRPAVSKHIKILYESGFIEIENIGRERFCKLNKDGFNEIQDWMNQFKKFWNEKLDSLELYLQKSKIKNSKSKIKNQKPKI